MCNKHSFEDDEEYYRFYLKECEKANLKLIEKVERYEKALKRIVQQTHCDDTWDFANRVLEGKPNNDLFYRINID